MPAGERMSVQSVAMEKAGHARPLTASADTKTWDGANARTRRARGAFMSPVHSARGRMGRRARSASLHFSLGPIPQLAETTPELMATIPGLPAIKS
jgi:hypothetical protein